MARRSRAFWCATPSWGPDHPWRRTTCRARSILVGASSAVSFGSMPSSAVDGAGRGWERSWLVRRRCRVVPSDRLGAIGRLGSASVSSRGSIVGLGQDQARLEVLLLEGDGAPYVLCKESLIPGCCDELVLVVVVADDHSDDVRLGFVERGFGTQDVGVDAPPLLRSSSGEFERCLWEMAVGQGGQEFGEAIWVEGLVRVGDRL